MEQVGGGFVVGAIKRAVFAARGIGVKGLFYKVAVGVPRGVAEYRHHHQPKSRVAKPSSVNDERAAHSSRGGVGGEAHAGC